MAYGRNIYPYRSTHGLQHCLYRGLPLLFVLLVALPVRCASESSGPQPVRPAAVAGGFYPANPEDLKQEVDRLLKAAPKADLKGRIVALVSPHAGYAYSGAIAAAAYRQVQGRNYDAAVVLAPSHREAFKGASVYVRGSYRTPLGLVPVHADLADAIVSEDKEVLHAGLEGHQVRRDPRRDEHSLEVQIPFLQRALPGVEIVPIVIGPYCDLRACTRIADAIVRSIEGRRVLLIASSDLYHGENYDDCVQTNTRTLDRIRTFDTGGLARGLDDGTCQACGAGPILIVMAAARQLGADRAEMLARTNSNDVTGQKGGYVVGYGAVAFIASENAPPETVEEADAGLSEDVRRELLRIARETLAHVVRGEPPPSLGPQHGILKERRAAFVTLTKGGNLRGCIGYLQAILPLGQTVRKMAESAALKDPRFPPVRPEEVEAIHIEISVLTPLRPLEDASQVQVGRHGLLIRQGNASGVLLPQVPVEQGWDRKAFLEGVCRKAGLRRDAWKEPETRLWTFQAEVFGEP